ncbi:peptidoglycan DD-metalloendopeptidase family protein [Burkholderia cenocepacia]|uniref:Peptidoglycan DD-metalloendopeptidase family protein n=1 Tax=Burkholderia cenocepacia TaxID=95486 RepID=A0ABD4UK48_9BURK|nr:peptidoglycan DD-metalloendopeptidase family protein [Burkholderia cenocepacia]MCW3698327.1 peptidoglycan DD-metalloendopeptidase family protein [Burkholderia cenocepacia]MCW3709080.1 peptidoglycan DD-metalloendopeptidase family protein [Burkholderia cenocepacia]MCW3714421.1 peptidoglycan DD-metalloendopeptidase family protein [Burkholderia cenocepacia]MCW3725153.1 peptidoglycan DD-metalloendopeptidase family protein [Burkholderia cenocepacia]MCW3733091.1 peptidoglycan DD-metalloendopeptida
MSMLRAMQNNRSREPLTLAQRAICVAAFSTLLAACATRLDNAPVVDRSGSLGTTATAQPGVPLGPPPPGFYRVKPGDTLYRIALENGQNYRDIASWNNLANPNQIEVDQLLRVAPPGGAAVAGAPAAAPIVGGAVATAPLSSGPAAPAAGTSSALAATPPAAATGSSDTAAAPSGPVTFAWPARGPVLNGFDDAKNKGVNIGGTAGEAVKAAADGRVVYSGNGLRGYGNLIIIKHDATYLTAYAHNRALMVKEGDAVTKGQKIAEMGNSDADRVMLHFEVRRQGKPVDPLKYLPPQ